MDKGFGDAHNYSIGSFVEFQNTLYAFTYNDETGTEAWRFDDSETWSQVNTDGFGNAETYWVFMRPVVVDGRLYVGYTNPLNGAGVFSTANGVDWTVEMSDGQGDTTSYAVCLYPLQVPVTFYFLFFCGFTVYTDGTVLYY